MRETEDTPNEQTAIQPVDADPMETDRFFLATWLFDKSPKTVTAYTSAIERLYAHTGKPLAALTLADVQAFASSLSEQPLAPRSRAQVLAAVKSALTFGLKTGYLPVNVGLLVKLPKIEDTLAERILSEAQVARLLALETNARNHALLVLLYRAGLRADEVAGLQWRHMTEREDGGAQLAIFGKGQKTRFVLIDEATAALLATLHKGSSPTGDTFVFQSRQQRNRKGERTQRRLTVREVEVIVRKAAKKAGLEGAVSPHWFRHAHATHALENGAPITLVRDTLGHASIETTSRYTHVRPNASSGSYLKV